MNFSFMIYLLLFLLIYFALTKNFNGKTLIILVLLFLTLLLNEIYNNNIYSKNDTFISSDYNDYLFDNDINPYEHGRDEFKAFIIPNSYDEQLKQGLICSTQNKILSNELFEKKLDSQHLYANKLKNIISGESSDLNLDDNVFNPIYLNEIPQTNYCPTVCHLIDDQDECINKLNIPVFENEEDFNYWVDRNITFCDNIVNPSAITCNNNDKCVYDNENNKCVYDNKMCFPHLNNDGKMQCLKRCEHINDDQDNNEVKKLKCESATLNSGEQYCEWDNLDNKCKPKCEYYMSKTECEAPSSREDCSFDNTDNMCVQQP